MKFWKLIACLLAIAFVGETALAQQVQTPSTTGNYVQQSDSQLGQQLDALLKPAKIALRNGNLAVAEDFYTQSLAVLPDFEARLNLAQIYEKENRLAEADAMYHIIVFHPGHVGNMGNDPTTLMRYVLLLLRMKNWSEAVVVYHEPTSHPVEELPNFDAKHPDYNRMEAVAHALLASSSPMHAHDWPPMSVRRAHSDAALKLEPNLPYVHFCNGTLLQQTNHKPEAKAAFLRAASLAGTDRYWHDRAKTAADAIVLSPNGTAP